jgi:glycosyltransferase involved in cell wall biosynthesis
VAWLGSAGLPVKRVASRLVAFEPRHPLVHRLKYTHTCHRVVALSGPVRQVLLKSGVPDTRIELIRGGIEFPTSAGGVDAGLQWRAEQGFTGQHFVVGHVAAFTAEKGQATALEALALLRVRLPSVVMVLVGEGPLRLASEMQARVGKTGGAARLPGYVQNLTGFYAGCDVFLMPSLSEALGVAALHAMAHGLPVIASRVGGLPEVVKEGETGWLVPPGDPEALAAAIVEAESDPVRLRRFGERARERAREFSCGATAAHTESMYRRLCGEE